MRHSRYNTSMASSAKNYSVVLTLLKILTVIVIARLALYYLGFTQYVPIVDDVASAILNALRSFGALITRRIVLSGLFLPSFGSL